MIGLVVEPFPGPTKQKKNDDEQKYSSDFENTECMHLRKRQDTPWPPECLWESCYRTLSSPGILGAVVDHQSRVMSWVCIPTRVRSSSCASACTPRGGVFEKGEEWQGTHSRRGVESVALGVAGVGKAGERRTSCEVRQQEVGRATSLPLQWECCQLRHWWRTQSTVWCVH